MKKLLTFFLVLLVSVSFLSAEPQKEKPKVGFALLWEKDDQGWTTAHYRGIQYLEEKMGDKIEILWQEKVVSATDAEVALRTFIDEGCQMVFGTTYDHMDACEILAEEFPDVVFEHCSGFKKNDTNFGNYFMRMYQAEYLAGYMAGLMGFRNIGTVGTHSIPEPVRGVNAFTLGLQRGLNESGEDVPDVVNTVVWLNAWREETNETVYAEVLSARGHDLIRQMADTPDSSRAACRKGVPAVGYGEDVSNYGVECALVSSVWNWGVYYVDAVQRFLEGTWKPGEVWWGFENDGVILTEFHESVPQDVREKVLAVKAELAAGEDNIFVGPLYDNEGKLRVKEGERLTDGDLLSMDWFVQGVNSEKIE